MTAFRRLALGFPLTWSHRRAYRLEAIARPGQAPYFIEWDPGTGVYGEDWTDASFDATGALLSAPKGAYHPIRIAQFALHCHTRWQTTGDLAARRRFVQQADWLRDSQLDGDRLGLYRFDFAWPKYGAESGWYSAMAQGEAISVLLRADSVEPSGGYGEAAWRAAAPFRKEIAHHGVVWRAGSDVFFEEVANRHAPHILNGCIYALWGVWELWKTTGDADYGRLAESCVATLLRWLPRYDTGWWSQYSLLRTAAGRSHIATLKYHQFHIAQMHVLGAMFDQPQFENAAQRWTNYVNRTPSRVRVLGASALSLPERALKNDTVAGGART